MRCASWNKKTGRYAKGRRARGSMTLLFTQDKTPPAAPMQVTWQRPPPPPPWRPPAAQPAPGPLPLQIFLPAAAITATGVPQGAATAWGPPPPLAAARGAAAASGQTAAAAAAAWGAPLGAAAAAAPTAPVGTNGAPVAELALGHSDAEGATISDVLGVIHALAARVDEIEAEVRQLRAAGYTILQ